MEKTCSTCGKSFGISRYKKYCCDDCKRVARRKYVRECYYRHHERNLEKFAKVRAIEKRDREEKLLSLPPLLRTKGNKPRTGNIKQCLTCKQDFYDVPSGKRMYCCDKCRDAVDPEKHLTLICMWCGKKYEISKSYFNIRGSKFCSVACRGKWQSKNQIGENSTFWKGGISSVNRRIRNSKKWKEWREAVFERDNYICQECGERGGLLEPHHIKPFAYFPELRFSIDNGVTLCQKCHNKTKTSAAVMRKVYESEDNSC